MKTRRLGSSLRCFLRHAALLPLGDGLGIDTVALGKRPQALLTMLYRSTDRLCRCGAAVKNLSHRASFHSLENNAPSNPGIKHLADILRCWLASQDTGVVKAGCSSNSAGVVIDAILLPPGGCPLPGSGVRSGHKPRGAWAIQERAYGDQAGQARSAISATACNSARLAPAVAWTAMPWETVVR